MKVAGLLNILFKINCENFDSEAKPNEALLLGKSITLLIVAKNYFQ